MLLHDAERAAVRPRHGRELGQRRGDAGMVEMNAFLAGANPRAAADLVAEARSLPGGIESERLQAEALLVGEVAERLERGAAGAEQAVNQRQRLGLGLRGRAPARPRAPRTETPPTPRPPPGAV